MDKKQVLAKIQKLLSLANSSNEHEAKLAADKASQLLTKHNLSTQDIKEGKQYSSIHIDQKRSRRAFHQDLIFSLLMEFFFIEVVQSRKIVRSILGKRTELVAVFIGEEHNVTVAKYVYEFLDRAFVEAWEGFKKKYEAEGYKGLTKHKKSFFTGFYAGIHENLTATRQTAEQEAGLVVVKDPGIKDFMDEMFQDSLSEGKALTTDANGGVAMDEGYSKGKETHIAMGLDSSNESSYIGDAPLKLGSSR